jgi:hypothetical protein
MKIFKKKKIKNELTPVEWIVGYLKSKNAIELTLATRMAIEKALNMERKNIGRNPLCQRCKTKDSLDYNIYCYDCDIMMAYN